MFSPSIEFRASDHYKVASDWTRVRSFALSVDRSRASLSLVLEVGQRAGLWSADQSSDFVQLKVVYLLSA